MTAYLCTTLRLSFVKFAGSKGRPGPALRSENWRGPGTASKEYAAEGTGAAASVVKPEPELVKSRNRNFSKVGTGTVQNSYGSTTLGTAAGMSGIKSRFQQNWRELSKVMDQANVGLLSWGVRAKLCEFWKLVTMLLVPFRFKWEMLLTLDSGTTNFEKNHVEIFCSALCIFRSSTVGFEAESIM